MIRRRNLTYSLMIPDTQVPCLDVEHTHQDVWENKRPLQTRRFPTLLVSFGQETILGWNFKLFQGLADVRFLKKQRKSKFSWAAAI